MFLLLWGGGQDTYCECLGALTPFAGAGSP